MPLPARDSKFWDSPALRSRSKHYPERFHDKVPVRIRMTKFVTPDPLVLLAFKCDGEMELRCGSIYEAHTNSHGAVAGICPNGKLLGVKPDEFEVVEFCEVEE